MMFHRLSNGRAVGVLGLVLVLTTGMASTGLFAVGRPPVTAAVSEAMLADAPALCRYGVGGVRDMSAYPVQDLRLGWYVDWGVATEPSLPDTLEYMPTVRLSQTSANSYGYTPDAATLAATATNHPGLTWLIGNEPDRRYWQDDLEPHLYAQAYHELYHLIKQADPTAQIAVGGIVQPTPVRLLYLDMVLESYTSYYGTAMPVDVWNIHAFILNEVSCEYDPSNCWGAEIPPGIDWGVGEIFDIQDNDNFAVFEKFVRDFRDWMRARGYQNRPLIVTEFGVQMPAMYGFDAARVNAFMDATFAFLEGASGPTGYPADDYRLVQRWAWYSLTDNTFNGWLYDPGTPPRRTVFGDNYAAHTSQIAPTVDLAPVDIATTPGSPYSESDPVTVTLGVHVANSGNVTASGPVVVRFYAGTPPQGQRIGADQTVVDLRGCGGTAYVSVTMTGVLPGTHPVYVVVDPDGQVAESDETDNVLAGNVLVSSYRLFMPQVNRSR